jgi:disulfide bond formation protein DsbB
LSANQRLAGAITALTALAALAVAYVAQYVLLLMPCELCLWERWPYRIVAALGVLAALLPRRPARAVLGLAALALLAGAGIAGLHVGVEFGWWNSPLPECNGILVPGAPLPAIPARPCDEPVYLIPHLPVSMAFMDMLYAAAFAFALSLYVLRRQRRFR